MKRIGDQDLAEFRGEAWTLDVRCGEISASWWLVL
jgi:hypothetical protein